MRSRSFYLLLFSIGMLQLRGGNADPLLKRGWAALVKDNDTTAIICFEMAYETALKEQDTTGVAAALLDLGICYYGVSPAKGIAYCFRAMGFYRQLERSQPQAALTGRYHCQQLLITIYGRQGKNRQVIALGLEALAGERNDSSGYLGLTYSSIGDAYSRLKMTDSSGFYYNKALQAQLQAHNMVYLPAILVKTGDIALKKGDALKSLALYSRARRIADSTENRQAQVDALIGAGKWQLAFGSADSAAWYYLAAKKTAAVLSDRSFYLRALQQLLESNIGRGRFREALDYRNEIAQVQDSMNAYDKHKLARQLEVQYNTAEKDRRLLLLKKEKDIAQLNNYLLWGTIIFIVVLSGGIIVALRRINTRNKLLLQTQEALVKALEEQKQLRERYLQNEIESKESQLSAMALQILQRNELLQELKKKMDEGPQTEDPEVKKIIGRGLNHEKEWSDFNAYFETLNQNFYARLKQAFPGISANDLRICALIKLNLSSKEMAGILNISPDSVKTARYRLRKKLSLTTEDNLVDFIRSL